jgi:hypothetical protein
MTISRVILWPLLFSVTALAQPQGAPAPTPPAETKAAGPKTDIDFEKAASMSDAEKTEKAGHYLSEMKQTLGSVLNLLKEARQEKDVIKVNCVNEKLVNIKGLLRISEQADVTLQEAVAKGEADISTHEFHKIAISHQKIKVLKAEAEQCVGELAFAVGKTTVEMEVDREVVPDKDPTDVSLPETMVVRPPAASPYQ